MSARHEAIAMEVEGIIRPMLAQARREALEEVAALVRLRASVETGASREVGLNHVANEIRALIDKEPLHD